MTRAQGGRQYLRDQIVVDRYEEGGLLGGAHRVLIERGVGALNTWVHDGRAGDRADVRKAAVVARRPRSAIRGTRRDGLVVPAGLVIQSVVFPKGAGDCAQTPLVRRAQTKFVLLVGVALDRVPGGFRREAGRRERAVVARSRTVALVVIRIHAACVIRVVAGLLDLAHEVTAGIDGLQISELAVHRQRGALESVLVV